MGGASGVLDGRWRGGQEALLRHDDVGPPGGAAGPTAPAAGARRPRQDASSNPGRPRSIAIVAHAGQSESLAELTAQSDLDARSDHVQGRNAGEIDADIPDHRGEARTGQPDRFEFAL